MIRVLHGEQDGRPWDFVDVGQVEPVAVIGLQFLDGDLDTFVAGVVLNAPAASVVLGFFCGHGWELDVVDLMPEFLEALQVLLEIKLFGMAGEREVELDDDKGVDDMEQLVESNFKVVKLGVE